MKKILILSVAVVAMLFTACGPKEDVVDSTALQGIKLAPSSVTLEEGESIKLHVKYTPDSAKATAPKVLWYSDKQRVASVNEEGLVTADRPGTAVITATCGKFEAHSTVDVLRKDLPEPDPKVVFSVEPRKIDAPVEGGTYEITVKSNVEWTAELENSEWATLSATSGDGDATLTLTVAGTENTEVASQDITFKAGKGSYYVRVTRAKKVIPMSLDKTEASVKVSGGSFTVSVTSESDWSVTCDDPRVSFNKTNNSVTVNVEKSTSEKWCNAEYDDRNNLKYWESIPITFSNEDSQVVLTLYQERPYVYLFNRSGSLTSVYMFHAMGDEKTFNVDLYSNISWEITLTPSWATVSKTSGTGDASFTLHFDKKTYFGSRDGYLVVHATGGYQCGPVYYGMCQD